MLGKPLGLKLPPAKRPRPTTPSATWGNVPSMSPPLWYGLASTLAPWDGAEVDEHRRGRHITVFPPTTQRCWREGDSDLSQTEVRSRRVYSKHFPVGCDLGWLLPVTREAPSLAPILLESCTQFWFWHMRATLARGAALGECAAHSLRRRGLSRAARLLRTPGHPHSK